MVTRAKIVKVLSDYEVKISVPIYGLIEELELESDVNELPVARICTTPGCSPNYKVGDTVVIGIEDSDLSKPMVLGKLIPNDTSLGASSGNFQNIVVEKDTKLTKNTTIGEVSSLNLEQLIGANYNIQGQFDTNMDQKIELLDFMTDILKNTNF